MSAQKFHQGERVLWTRSDGSQYVATVIDGNNWRDNVEIVTDEPWREDGDASVYGRHAELHTQSLILLTADASASVSPPTLF